MRCGPLLALALAACAGTEEGPPSTTTSIIRGTIVFAEGDAAHVTECESGRKLVLGAMASGPSMRLRERYDRLSEGGKGPVFVEFSGTVVQSRNVTSLERPGLLAIKPGPCR